MRISEMTARQQINFALSGDPEDDDTYNDDEPTCPDPDYRR
jgi:hypothetical protein